MPAGIARGRYRSLFISDVHLGCRHAQAERLLTLLRNEQPARLYLVGDFIDGWRLKRRWHWQVVYIQILQRLVELAATGTRIYYTPGNHDEFLRDYLHDFGIVTVADQFIHQTADGRRFVVLHGDRFDNLGDRVKWLSLLGSSAYDSLVSLNGVVNQIRRALNLDDYRFSHKVKFWTRQAVQFISDFEERLVCHAKDQECDGVICGHIHVPRIELFGDILYCNSGDWVENCTALGELDCGKFELVRCEIGSASAVAESVRLQDWTDTTTQEPSPETIAARIRQLAHHWRLRTAS